MRKSKVEYMRTYRAKKKENDKAIQALIISQQRKRDGLNNSQQALESEDFYLMDDDDDLVSSISSSGGEELADEMMKSNDQPTTEEGLSEEEDFPEEFNDETIESGELFDEVGGLDQDLEDFELIPNYHDGSRNVPIYDESPITLDSFITIALFLITTMQIGTSKIDTLLKTLNLLLPSDNIIPKTRQQLFNYIPFMNSMKRVYYCDDCKCYCEGKKCGSCGKICNTHFLYHSLGDQLKERTRDLEFCNHLK